MTKTKTITIYRNGSLTPSTYTGEIAAISAYADTVIPDDRAGRIGSLYGSPSIEGVRRWTRANLMGTHIMTDRDPETYELTVNPEGLYCYPVRAWDDYSWRGRDPDTYWEQGIPLTEWNDDHGDPSEWEILFTEKEIIRSRRVSKKRLLKGLKEYRREELESLLRRHRVR